MQCHTIVTFYLSVMKSSAFGLKKITVCPELSLLLCDRSKLTARKVTATPVNVHASLEIFARNNADGCCILDGLCV